MWNKIKGFLFVWTIAGMKKYLEDNGYVVVKSSKTKPKK